MSQVSKPTPLDPDEKVEWHTHRAPQRRGPGRPRKDPYADEKRLTTPEALEAQREALSQKFTGRLVTGGVTFSWLAAAYRIDPRTCQKRLAGLKPIANGGTRNSPLYDFVEASMYLAPPHPDKFMMYMKSLRTQDMPTQLQDTYWSALRKKQIWEENAQHLWRTNDVLDVFAETFKTMKSTIQLWVDNLDATGEMDEAQRARLTQMVDGLLAELHSSLVEMPAKRKTYSSLHDPDVITNQGRQAAVEDDEDEDLIG